MRLDNLPSRSLSSVRRRLRGIWRFAKSSPLNAFAIVLVLGVLFCAIFGPLIAPYPPDQTNFAITLAPPSVHHLFGTDELGRDLFSRILYGARISLEVAAIILSFAVVFGTLLGIVSGYLGGLVDEIIMRITDLFLGFPALILAAAIAATLGPSLNHTIIALAIVWWPWYARLARGQVLALREREFIVAAGISGASVPRVVLRHLLPNIYSLMVVQLSMDVGNAILSTSSLSFLGLGAQPPEPEWGAIIAQGSTYILNAWWYVTFPGIALALTVLGFNLLGEGLRDWMDPKLR
jgi:peptide/nickel transport system permease protein